MYFALSGLGRFLFSLPGATRFALAPGYYIARLRRCFVFAILWCWLSFCPPSALLRICDPLVLAIILPAFALFRICDPLVLAIILRAFGGVMTASTSG